MKFKQTSVAEFTHPRTASRVTLVGNRHVGTPEYIHTIGGIVDDYSDQGVTVHYEGLRSILATGDRIATDPAMFSSPTLHIRKIINKEKWERHDASMADLVQRATLRQGLALRAFGGMANLATYVDEVSDVKANSNAHEEATVSVAETIGELIVNGLFRQLDPLIVDYRNEIALSAVDSALEVEPTQDVALLWGQAHLKGLGLGLRRRGYKQTSLRKFDPMMRDSSKE